MFRREIELIGLDNFNKIKNSIVCVVGLGGVGGHAVETLIRSGINNLIIVDYDIVDISNKNRQIIATDKTIGFKKTEAMKQRCLEINSEANIIIVDKKLNLNNIMELFNYKFDYLIDACDTVIIKKKLIQLCLLNKIPFISSMGTGNKLDPLKLKICDIRETNYDPLARNIRQFIKTEKISKKVMVVSSFENPIKKSKGIASISCVPATAGILCASYIINSIIEKGEKK